MAALLQEARLLDETLTYGHRFARGLLEHLLRVLSYLTQRAREGGMCETVCVTRQMLRQRTCASLYSLIILFFSDELIL